MQKCISYFRHDTIFESSRIIPMQYSKNKPGSKIKKLELEGMSNSRFKFVYSPRLRIIYDFDTFHEFLGYDRMSK